MTASQAKISDESGMTDEHVKGLRDSCLRDSTDNWVTISRVGTILLCTELLELREKLGVAKEALENIEKKPLAREYLEPPQFMARRALETLSRLG
jgi:hypothetical protein